MEPQDTTYNDIDFADRVHRFLLKQRYGARISLERMKDPERFRKAVIYLIDFGAISTNVYEFSSDYTILRKHEPVNLAGLKKNRQVDRGIYDNK